MPGRSSAVNIGYVCTSGFWAEEMPFDDMHKCDKTEPQNQEHRVRKEMLGRQ